MLAAEGNGIRDNWDGVEDSIADLPLTIFILSGKQQKARWKEGNYFKKLIPSTLLKRYENDKKTFKELMEEVLQGNHYLNYPLDISKILLVNYFLSPHFYYQSEISLVEKRDSPKNPFKKLDLRQFEKLDCSVKVYIEKDKLNATVGELLEKKKITGKSAKYHERVLKHLRFGVPDQYFVIIFLRTTPVKNKVVCYSQRSFSFQIRLRKLLKKFYDPLLKWKGYVDQKQLESFSKCVSEFLVPHQRLQPRGTEWIGFPPFQLDLNKFEKKRQDEIEDSFTTDAINSKTHEGLCIIGNGTGFFISPYHVMTCFHNLFRFCKKKRLYEHIPLEKFKCKFKRIDTNEFMEVYFELKDIKLPSETDSRYLTLGYDLCIVDLNRVVSNQHREHYFKIFPSFKEIITCEENNIMTDGGDISSVNMLDDSLPLLLEYNEKRTEKQYAFIIHPDNPLDVKEFKLQYNKIIGFLNIHAAYLFTTTNGHSGSPIVNQYGTVLFMHRSAGHDIGDQFKQQFAFGVSLPAAIKGESRVYEHRELFKTLLLIYNNLEYNLDNVILVKKRFLDGINKEGKERYNFEMFENFDEVKNLKVLVKQSIDRKAEEEHFKHKEMKEETSDTWFCAELLVSFLTTNAPPFNEKLADAKTNVIEAINELLLACNLNGITQYKNQFTIESRTFIIYDNSKAPSNVVCDHLNDDNVILIAFICQTETGFRNLKLC